MVNSVTFYGGSLLNSYDPFLTSPLPPGSKASSGQLCPQSGVWKSEVHQVVVGISKGNVMPQYQSQSVEWQLTKYSLADLEKAKE